MNCAKQLIQHVSKTPRTLLVRVAHAGMSEGSWWKQEWLALSAACLGADTLSSSAAERTVVSAHPSLFTRCDPNLAVVFLLLHYSLIERGNKTDENAPSFEVSSLFEVLMELYSSLLYLLPHQNEKRAAANQTPEERLFFLWFYLQILFQCNETEQCIIPGSREV